MATLETLKRLAKVNQESLKIHLDVKQLIPEQDANTLCYANFTDCSDKDLAGPCYYFNKDWANETIPVIIVNEDLDANWICISGKVTYSILLNNPGCNIQYKHFIRVEDAIIFYLDLAGLA